MRIWYGSMLQRKLKAALVGQPDPYGDDLAARAQHITDRESSAKKVERQVTKSALAIQLQHRVGEWFTGLVLDTNNVGTFVTVGGLGAPVEGKLMSGGRGLNIGDPVRVQLSGVDVLRGHINFTAASSPQQVKRPAQVTAQQHPADRVRPRHQPRR